MTKFDGGGGGLLWQITDWNFNWISSNTYKNPMIGIKGLEEGKNGITLIEDKVVMWQKKNAVYLTRFERYSVSCLVSVNLGSTSIAPVSGRDSEATKASKH